jgi:uncharacterized protein YuzE
MNRTAIEPRPAIQVQHDKTTDVAYVDLFDAPKGIRIDVIDVSGSIGLRTTVLGRFDENGKLLGLTIENYKQFRREVMRQYLALAVERIIVLLVDRVKASFSESHPSRGMQLAHR